jgi:hypothetical protein
MLLLDWIQKVLTFRHTPERASVVLVRSKQGSVQQNNLRYFQRSR